MRFAALVVLPLAVWTLACSDGPPMPSREDPTPTPTPDAGPPLPEVTLPGTTQPSAGPGLCTSWSSTVLNLSSLAASPTDGYAPRTFVHGIEGGFSIVSVARGSGRVATLAFDSTGSPRGPEVDLPVEPLVVSDAIATSEGGWLAAWSSGSVYSSCTGDLSFVHYDGSGTPTGQTASQSGAGGAFGAEPGGTTDVVWCNADPSPSSRMAKVSAFPFALAPGASFAPDATESSLGWRRGTLLSLECPDTEYCDYNYGTTLRTWSTSGQPTLDALLPDDLVTALGNGSARASPGNDPSAALVAQASGVSFVSDSQVLVVPSDVLLNSGSPWPASPVAGAQRAVVGFDGHVVDTGDGSGSDALEIVEVTSSGARSILGQVSLPANPQRALASSAVYFTATLAEDAYLVVLVGPTIEGAVFTCTGRAS